MVQQALRLYFSLLCFCFVTLAVEDVPSSLSSSNRCFREGSGLEEDPGGLGMSLRYQLSKSNL